jgi:hypothetical protein
MEHRKAEIEHKMLRPARKLTKREEHTAGLTASDGNKIARAIGYLQRVSRPELLSAEIEALLARLLLVRLQSLEEHNT